MKGTQKIVEEVAPKLERMRKKKAKDLQERTAFIEFLKEQGIMAVFHYVPLHSAPAGYKYGRFDGIDEYTTKESERLLRLPMYYGLTQEEVEYVCDKVKGFYSR